MRERVYVVRDWRDAEVDARSTSADEALKLAEGLRTQNGFKHRAPFTVYLRTERPVFRIKRDGGYETITTPEPPMPNPALDRETAEPDFLSADDTELARWWNDYRGGLHATIVAFRDAIVRQARATPASPLTDIELSKAWNDAEAAGASYPFNQAWFALAEPNRDVVRRFADALLALGRSRVSPDALTEAKREAASKAWEAAAEWWKRNRDMMPPMDLVHFTEQRDRYLAREYPLPAPRVVLSDGSTVHYDPKAPPALRWVRTSNKPGCVCPSHEQWTDVLAPIHTGADFDALKAFAAAHGPGARG